MLIVLYPFQKLHLLCNGAGTQEVFAVKRRTVVVVHMVDVVRQILPRGSYRCVGNELPGRDDAVVAALLHHLHDQTSPLSQQTHSLQLHLAGLHPQLLQAWAAQSKSRHTYNRCAQNRSTPWILPRQTVAWCNNFYGSNKLSWKVALHTGDQKILVAMESLLASPNGQ